MTHSEDLNPILTEDETVNIFKKLKANKDDAFVLFFAPDEDIQTALETIEERCRMAFVGVPEETRKSFGNGTTIFERVLPGADRMYPDTDSAPIPLSEEYIETVRKRIPSDIIDRYKQLKEWGIAEDTYTYIFSKNLYSLLEKIVKELNISAKYIGTFLGHNLKFIEGHYKSMDKFDYNLIFDLFKYIMDNNIKLQLAESMIIELYQHPKMDFDSILQTIKFKRISEDEIIAQIPFLKEKFQAIARKQGQEYEHKWIMGQLHYLAMGNIDLNKLSAIIKEK
jgi:glutamyl-tRNA(Gln) amidotransferase subunit E